MLKESWVLPAVYLGNTDYYAALAASPSATIDIFENYQKQSYRNRAEIMSANGKLALTLPVEKLSSAKQTIKDTKLSYGIAWQRIHTEAIKSAYGSAAFFEYYADELLAIICNKHKFLADLLLEGHIFIYENLHICKAWEISKSYCQHPIADFRQLMHPKKDPISKAEAYTQVFSSKHTFCPHLSAIDLLFCCGPESESIITAMADSFKNRDCEAEKKQPQ
jgi:hypothetical protein